MAFGIPGLPFMSDLKKKCFLRRVVNLRKEGTLAIVKRNTNA